jgi:hypothetical protein
MTVLAALLLPSLLGFCILALLLRDDGNTPLLERLCLSFPLGAGFLTMQMFVLGLLRVPLTLPFTALPVAFEVIALSAWIARKRIPAIPKPSFGLIEELFSSRTGRARKAALALLALWAGIKLASVFVETGLRPIYAWDSWANWSVGAKLFYYAKSLLLDVPAADFFTRGAVLRITSYPVHNPLMQMWLSLWTGRFDEVLVKFWTPVYLLSMSLYLYQFAQRELNRIAAMGLLVIFLGSPLLSYHAVEVYSDLPLGAYLVFALASFLYAMRGRKSYWPLVGLFLAEAVFTKDEAVFFAAPLLLSAAVYIWRHAKERSERRALLVRLLAPLLLAAPWYVFKFSHALGLGADFIKLEFTFHPEIIWPALLGFLSLENFNVVLFFFPILLLVSGKPSREFLHLLFAVVCYAAFFLSVYVFTTFYYGHFLKGTVFYRNILTYYPGILLLTVLLLGKRPVLPQKKQKRRKAGASS